jgi:hypothetical protein
MLLIVYFGKPSGSEKSPVPMMAFSEQQWNSFSELVGSPFGIIALSAFACLMSTVLSIMVEMTVTWHAWARKIKHGLYEMRTMLLFVSTTQRFFHD